MTALETAWLTCLYLAPILVLFAGMAALSDYLEKRYDPKH